MATPLDATFDALRALLAVHADALDVKQDDATRYYLDTRHRQKNGQPLFFGAVQRRKAAISLHLMPVYLQPALLDGLSPALRARMQGKSCFNLATPDAALVQELGALVAAGFASYRARGVV